MKQQHHETLRGLYTMATLATLVAAQGWLGGAAATEPDWTIYDDLLRTHVSRGVRAGVELNLMDYAGLSQDPSFVSVVTMIADFPLEQLESHEELLAFYINSYNVLALKTVIDNWPLDSIKDVGNLFSPVWKRPAGTVGGRTLSLDDIEHGVLRKMNEPRIHFALVCASVSCPDLRTEAYRANRLSQQLDAQCSSFLHNTGKGLQLSGRRARVSKIFKWFAADFETVGGAAAFIRRYYPLAEDTAVQPSLNYNWSLNGVRER